MLQRERGFHPDFRGGPARLDGAERGGSRRATRRPRPGQPNQRMRKGSLKRVFYRLAGATLRLGP